MVWLYAGGVSLTSLDARFGMVSLDWVTMIIEFFLDVLENFQGMKFCSKMKIVFRKQ